MMARSKILIFYIKRKGIKKFFQFEINMAHQLGISIKYLKQTTHLSPVHQCNIKRNLIDQVSTVHILILYLNILDQNVKYEMHFK